MEQYKGRVISFTLYRLALLVGGDTLEVQGKERK